MVKVASKQFFGDSRLVRGDGGGGKCHEVLDVKTLIRRVAQPPPGTSQRLRSLDDLFSVGRPELG
ncbi:hypothetical protein ACFFX0_25275 [Citricoccus parietis]|uniref:Uncharacterized protein n=1 Tax=Citricoccus parietis TaxID=592307 RepID=A0ABV5G5W1_9MICC